jgi:hypothetical protein
MHRPASGESLGAGRRLRIMSNQNRVSAILAASAATACTFVSSGNAASPSLYVRYDTSCAFTVTDDSGSVVNAANPISPGAYQVVISTPFSFANAQAACEYIAFRLAGPGISLTTSLGAGDEATEQHTETFQPNSSYTAEETSRPATLTTIRTTSTPTGSAPTGGASAGNLSTGSSEGDLVGSGRTSAVIRATLKATVSPTGKTTLELNGKNVSSLEAGRYKIAVTDRTSKSGFLLQALGNVTTTVSGVSFVGKRSITIKLNRGRWFFSPIPTGKKTAFAVI